MMNNICPRFSAFQTQVEPLNNNVIHLRITADTPEERQTLYTTVKETFYYRDEMELLVSPNPPAFELRGCLSLDSLFPASMAGKINDKDILNQYGPPLKAKLIAFLQTLPLAEKYQRFMEDVIKHQAHSPKESSVPIQSLHPLTQQVLKEIRLAQIQKAIPEVQLEIGTIETQLAQRRSGLERLQQAAQKLQRELGIIPQEPPQ